MESVGADESSSTLREKTVIPEEEHRVKQTVASTFEEKNSTLMGFEEITVAFKNLIYYRNDLYIYAGS